LHSVYHTAQCKFSGTRLEDEDEHVRTWPTAVPASVAAAVMAANPGRPLLPTCEVRECTVPFGHYGDLPLPASNIATNHAAAFRACA
jgi:hypothetical protein